jgi:hypothetical protein
LPSTEIENSSTGLYKGSSKKNGLFLHDFEPDYPVVKEFAIFSASEIILD